MNCKKYVCNKYLQSLSVADKGTTVRISSVLNHTILCLAAFLYKTCEGKILCCLQIEDGI